MSAIRIPTTAHACARLGRFSIVPEARETPVMAVGCREVARVRPLFAPSCRMRPLRSNASPSLGACSELVMESIFCHSGAGKRSVLRCSRSVLT